MHTRKFTHTDSDGNEHVFTFHYNSDLSGTVLLHYERDHEGGRQVIAMHIPPSFLIDFVCERVAERHIERLEENPRSVFGLDAIWP